MAEAITNFDDVIDSRDVTQRIEELEGELEEAMEEHVKERTAELTDIFQGSVDEMNSVETPEDSDPPVSVEDLIEVASFDTSHYLHAEAEELEELREGLDLDDYVREAAGDPRHLMYDEATEYKALKDLAEQAEGYSDWKYGAQLIRETYFKDYAQQLAEDIGAVNADATWPNNCIDWDQAARELEDDYTQIDFDGVAYFVRS